MRIPVRWPFTLFLALLTVVLSVAGYYFFPHGRAPGPIEWLQSTIDLFKMSWKWDGTHAAPWPLELARYTGAAFTLSALTKVWMKFFGEQMRRFRLGFWRGHVVVCGLGRKGLDLARTFRRLRQRVAATDSRPDEDDAEACQFEGVLLETGDATRDHTLAMVGVERARYVFAVCRDDHTNIEVAMQTLVRYRECGRRSRLNCYVHLVNLPLSVLLQRHELLRSRPEGFELRFFNIFENTARALFAKHPPEDPAGLQRVHLVVVGLTRLGEAVITQAARVGHYADLRKVRVTMVDAQATARAESFLARQPGIAETCEVRVVEMSFLDARFARLEFVEAAADERTTVIFCLDADDENIALALAVAERGNGPGALLARVSERKGLAKLLNVARPELSTRGIHPFGSVEDVCSWDLLREEKLDVLAKTIADFYRKTYGGPAWEELPEDLRNSNRAAADHIDVKLRAVGCERCEVLASAEPAFAFTGPEVDLLAKMEHERWCADRRLAGWTPGPRDNERRLHPNLVAWGELSADDQGKDRAQVVALPAVLAGAGFGIRRVAGHTARG
ncbi:MAG: NAD-binding protein [Chthoniobacteraceae bacterium]